MSRRVRHVRPGDRLKVKASDWNSFADAANAHMARQFSGGARGSSAPAAAGMVLVKNASGAARDRFDVLGISGVLIDPDDSEAGFLERVALSGATPDEDLHLGKFVILAEPAASGAIARAWAFGACPVTIDVDDVDEADYADIADGVTGYLTAGLTGGARILWRDGGTGQQWAVVLIGIPSPVQPTDGSEYQLWQLEDIGGGVLAGTWEWARMHS